MATMPPPRWPQNSATWVMPPGQGIQGPLPTRRRLAASSFEPHHPIGGVTPTSYTEHGGGPIAPATLGTHRYSKTVRMVHASQQVPRRDAW